LTTDNNLPSNLSGRRVRAHRNEATGEGVAVKIEGPTRWILLRQLFRRVSAVTMAAYRDIPTRKITGAVPFNRLKR
jgi:hypothetical protein